MNTPRSVASLIARLRTLPPGVRETELDRACATDPALEARRIEICDALAANHPVTAGTPAGLSESPDQFSLATAMHVLESALELSAPETSGTLLGPYKLREKIGEGGFGTVWMADQQAPIQRRVALKIIKVGMDTEEVIARFEAERQALALMDHPNIARVFDAGSTAAGRPYFVMELVRGVAITRFCDENRLPAAARLELFIAVCQAVQHAHQKGIIHRDLKPSNVLVTLHDGVPVPKVIDFGIAKATQGRLTDHTLFTRFHAFMGTPAYTSPEQMEMSGLDIDTRSDVYSLGVLLYELLAGHPPFDPVALVRSGLDAMRRTIREVDPPRPSNRLGTLAAEQRTTIAEKRGTNVANLSVLLRGDLDWIVMRCLEKDRARRYATTSDLAQDIRRHLGNEPVAARPPSTLYRLGKVARRNRVAFIASTAVALSIVAGLIVSSLLWWSERAAHARAQTAEKTATTLRHAAETARANETTRAARTALELANRELDEGRVADGLAWLVYAAGKDPLSPAIAPRIASVLTSHSFLLPEGAPFECGSGVVATRFAADGRTFFVGTLDGSLRVFDAASGRMLRQFALGQPVKRFGGFQFARANDEVFAARFEDNTLAVFEVATGQPVAPPLPPVERSPNDAELIDSVGLSSDGRWAYSINWQGFHVRNVATGELRIELTWRQAGLTPSDWDFSADGRHALMVIGSTVHVWSLAEGDAFKSRIVIQSKPVRALARFTPDGGRIAVLEHSVGVRLFGLEGTELGEPLPYAEYVERTAWDFMPDGRLLIPGRKSAQIFDLKTRQVVPVPFGWSGHFWTRAFNRDGTRLVTFDAGGTARLWDTATGTLCAEPVLEQGSFARIALSPDGTRVAIGTALGGVQRLRVTPRPARPLELPVGPQEASGVFPGKTDRLMVFGSESARLFSIGSARELSEGFSFPHPIHALLAPLRHDLPFVVTRDRGNVWEAWELGAGGVRKVVPLRDAPRSSARVDFSPARDRVLLGTHQEFRVWDLRTGEPVGPAIANRPNGPRSPPVVQFSPDGTRVAMVGGGGFGSIFEIASGHEVTRLQPLPNMMSHHVVFSPDGTRLVTALRAGEARLWDAATGAPISPVLHHTDFAKNPFFSRDGRFFATNTETQIRFWDGRTGAPLGPPLDVSENNSARLSSDDERVLIASGSGFARVWHVRTGQPLTGPMTHRNRIGGGHFSPDGRFALIFSKPLYIWPVPPSQPSGEAVPAWLLQLATAHAGKVVDEDGRFTPLPDVAARIEAARRMVDALPAAAPLAEWGRWIIDDRADRPIAPGLTVAESELEKLPAALAPKPAQP